MNFLLIIAILCAIYLINFFFKQNKFLLNYTGESHQKFTGKKNIPLSGGILILIFSSIYLIEIDSFLYLFSFLIFFIGLFSDLKKINSPFIRLILQTFSLIIIIYFTGIKIETTRIIILDRFLDLYLFNLFFTVFCLLVVINGTNFIDGLNGLVLGYYFLVLIIIYNLDLLIFLNLDNFQIKFLLILIFILFIFNLSNKFYLGDSGAYLLGFIIGYLLILIYSKNQFSPFFIILLLWYPCFENLFSIIRKFRFSRLPSKADNNHLHQLFFYFMKKKFKFKNIYSNILSSLLLILYNAIVFFIASGDIYNTQFQIVLVFINLLIYTFIYIQLFKFRIKLN